MKNKYLKVAKNNNVNKKFKKPSLHPPLIYTFFLSIKNLFDTRLDRHAENGRARHRRRTTRARRAAYGPIKPNTPLVPTARRVPTLFPARPPPTRIYSNLCTDYSVYSPF
ncbi:hypothetical protein EVAR_18745_1 [Eumeta japonica]|uniref:Uncharacterized protein n=1 Tax=Eumeta variegata TaxID=151549 RepID=A0A4C1UM78_EUMVA|nr:hypothetical protein EVAR_18745_1 [Eumeta japonica]